MFIIISIILIFISILFALIPNLNKHRKSYPELFNFSFTLIATFIGVFGAIELTNRIEEKKEIDNVIKLLNATQLEIDNKIYTCKMNLAIFNLEMDSFSIKEFMKHNQVQMPNLLLTTITNEALLRRLTENGIKELHSNFDELKNLQENINSEKEDSLIIQGTSIYVKQLALTKKVLAIEASNLSGDITITKLGEQYDSFPINKGEGKVLDLDSATEEHNKQKTK